MAAEQELAYETKGFSTQMWAPFAAWVTKAHPKDAAVMYADWPSQSVQALNERSIEPGNSTARTTSTSRGTGNAAS